MTGQLLQQYLTGGGAVILGVLAWVLPCRWNPFRLRRFLGSILSEKANRRVPVVIGAILFAGGVAILIGTAMTGEFK